MQPTLEEWRQLYSNAKALYEVAPWNWMWDRDVFGVQPSEGEETGYCCVMGRLGEHFALAVYLGSEGLDGLWRMQQGEFHHDAGAILAAQKCLMVSFEDREMIDKTDLAVIRQLGLKFRGRNAWTQFRSYRPGYMPWYLTAEEVRYLAIVLEQSLDVVLRLRENPGLLPMSHPHGKYLVRISEGTKAGVLWKDALLQPTPISPIEAHTAVSVDTEEIAQIKKAYRVGGMTWQIDFAFLPRPIYGEGDERPWFPYVILVVDTASGMVLTTEIVPPVEIVQRLPEVLLAVIEQIGQRPKKVTVRNHEAKSCLQPTARTLGITLTQVRQLPMIEDAFDSLFEYMG